MWDEPDISLLSNALRAEWRADEAAWSRAALERWEHDRTLADVLRDCMHRGDTVAVAFASLMLTGTVASVGTDLVRVATPDGAVDLRVNGTTPAVVRIVAAARQGGGRGDETVATFAARLRQLEGARVRLGLHMTPDVLEGELRMGRDQVSVITRARDRAYVAIGSVAWVRPVDDD